MKIKAYAKINLMLDILGVLPNGYHDLWMIMQSVSLCDIVEVRENDSGKITLTSSVDSIPTDERNIAYKAASAFFEFTNIQNKGVHIHIEKHIPHEAGLAGGSADGAAVIKALDKIYNTNLRERDLCRIGKKIGADIPFCIVGGTCLAQNIGDVLSPLEDIEDCYFVLAKPKMGVSTKEAFHLADTATYLKRPKKNEMLRACCEKDFDKICHLLSNVFEQVIEVPERVEIKKIMRNNNCQATLMSGSGPTVYGIFKDKNEAEKCLKDLQETIEDVFLATPVKQALEIIE